MTFGDGLNTPTFRETNARINEMCYEDMQFPLVWIIVN